MKDSLYHSMDAPVAPIENKIEALKPAEKACFVLDLYVASCQNQTVSQTVPDPGVHASAARQALSSS